MSLDHAVLGFREWPITKDGLGAVTGRAPWVPGVNVADCEHRNGHDPGQDGTLIGFYLSSKGEVIEPHVPPSAECGCGLYAWHTLDGVLDYHHQRSMWSLVEGKALTIYGAIAGWGRTYAHRDGWRAEKARILAFAVRDDTEFMQALGRFLADMYKVPLVPFDMLQLEGARHAAAVPEALLPPKPKPREPDPIVGSWQHLVYANPMSVRWTVESGGAKPKRKKSKREKREERVRQAMHGKLNKRL